MDSLLSGLTSDDVQELIDQEKLINDHGLVIHYAVDHSEVSKYCFPLGFDEDRSPIADWDLMIDRQVVRQRLFSKHQVLFYKEYDREFERLINFLNHTITGPLMSDLKMVIEHLAQTRQPDYTVTPQDQNREANAKRYVQDHLPFILAVCLGFGEDGIRKLVHIDNEVLLKQKADVLAKKNWPSMVADSFDDKRFLDIALQFLNELQNERGDNQYNRILQVESQSLREDSEKIRRNRETDCKVMARVVCLNEQLNQAYKKKQTEKQHFFQLISFTDNVKKISQLNTLKRHQLRISPYTLSPYRSLAQRYLWLLCEGSDRIKELENFKWYVEYSEQAKNNQSALYELFKHKGDQLNTTFDQRIRAIREQYESQAIKANYLFTKVESQEQGNKQDLSPVKQLLSRFKGLTKKDVQDPEFSELFVDALNWIEKHGPSDLEQILAYKLIISNELKREQSYQFRVLEGLRELRKIAQSKDTRKEFYLLRGDDSVRGSFQHNPIAFYTSDRHKEILGKIIGLFVQLSLDRGEIRQVIDYLLDPKNKFSNEDDFSYKEGVNYDPLFEEKLVQYIVTLLLPRPTLDQRPDEILFNLISEVIEEQEVKNIGTESSRKKWKSIRLEFYYFMAWLSRRIRRYDISQEYAEKGQSIDPNDMRFVHAQCLIAYCHAHDRINLERPKAARRLEVIKWLNQCYSLAVKALEMLCSNTHKPFTIDVTKQLTASLQNTAVYTQTLLAEWDEIGKNKYLQQANVHLEALKQFDQYDSFPEFLHTEATLLKDRALFRVTGDKKSAQEYKREALDRIALAIRLNSSSQLKSFYEQAKNEILSITVW